MSRRRLETPWGELIDRTKPVTFQFNRHSYVGFEGDTVASALIANGVRLVGRSFKLHRPRGIFSCGVEEPSAIVDAGTGPSRTPNVRATLLPILNGLSVESVNCWPSLRFDIGAMNGLVSSLLPAGFYYKTFKWPSWHLFEPTIRRMAGLGRSADEPDPDRYDELSVDVDVLVVGGGVAGLTAAAAAAETGAQVCLVTSHPRLGQNLTWRASTINADELIKQVRRSNIRILTDATAFGLYDHNLVCVRENLRAAVEGPGPRLRERLWKIRARSIVAACGAFEKPMVFPDNDRPGVMLAGAAQKYAHAYGVACGTRVVISANSDSAYGVAQTLRRCGLEIVAIADCRPPETRGHRSDSSGEFYTIPNAIITSVLGSHSVRGCEISLVGHPGHARRFECDLILGAGGFTPAVHLHSQAGGKLRWDDRAAMFIPIGNPPGITSVGACAGVFDVNEAVEHAENSGRAVASGTLPPMPPVGGAGLSLRSTRVQMSKRKQFIDLQNDVVASDIDLAAQEGYRSVEHLKRYTTTGMGTDQGKTSNVNALVLLGQATDRTPEEVGTTKFRPPFVPVCLGVLAGFRKGDLLRPRKMLAAHGWHAERGAAFEEYGGWIRPAAYPRTGESVEAASLREAASTRQSAGLFDGSPLGKLEVFGPDAARFLDFMYVGTMSTLAIGRARYGLLLNENGNLIDDGIVARLAQDRFWVNTSSAGAERTAAVFDEWLQCEFPNFKALVTSVTARWSNITVAGPRAWDWLRAVGMNEALAPGSMQHMSIQDADLQGMPLRVLRASFSGELSYEINVPAGAATSLLERLWAGRDQFDTVAYGVEALQVMRIEKGYIHIGSDTDGTTVPSDIGYGGAIDRKRSDFVGRRSLGRPAARDPDRLQLVGLEPLDRRTRLPVGAQIAISPPPAQIEGHVTSSTFSPVLGRPVALAMLRGGGRRIGEPVHVHHNGRSIAALVVKAPFVDPDGSRLHG